MKLTRQAGSPAATSQIATVADAQDDESALAITVNGSATATSNGVTVSNLSVDASGAVTATVSAACAASPAGFTLRVTDTGGLFGEATLAVFVTPDTQPPIITLNGANPLVVECRTGFTDPGATATNNCSGSVPVTASGGVNTGVPGTYTITYAATDGRGNTATRTRTVNVVDTTRPVIQACATDRTLLTNGASQVALPDLRGEIRAADVCVPSPLTISQSPAPGTMLGFGTTTVTFTVTDAAGNQATCAAQVNVLNFRLSGFAVFSQEQTELRANARVVSGSVGTNNSLPDPNGGADDTAEIILGANAQVQHSAARVVGDTISLSANSSIFNVSYNELYLGPNSSVRGTRSTPLQLPVADLPALPQITPGTQDITVNPNQTRTLPAGSYRTITVRPNGKLILTGGLYQLMSLDVQPNAEVRLQAAAEVQIKQQLSAAPNAYLGPASASVTAQQIVIFVEGGDGGGRVAADLSGTVQANIYAAQGTLTLQPNTKAVGAFIGRRVVVGENVEVRLLSAF